MSTLEQMREGLHRALDSVSDGWRQLSERATSALTRFNPVHHPDSLQTADEQLVASASRWGLLAAEVTETDTAIVVRMEAPGMERDDFDLDIVEGRYLVVRGEKRAERQEQRGRYYVMERAYGRFERAIPLPVMVDEGGTSARYHRGVLQVTLPKAATARARRIPVEG